MNETLRSRFSQRVFGRRFPGMAVGLAVGLCGCQSIESSRVVGAIEQVGRTSEDRGEVRIFLEVAAPEPAWIREEESQRERYMEASYQDDVRRGLLAYEVPTAFRLALADFQREATQASAPAPYVTLHLLERQKISVKKRHQVSRRGLLARSSEMGIEEVPVWTFWRPLPPADRAARNEQIDIYLPDEIKSLGIFSTVSGRVDPEGRLQVSLAPWLSHMVKQGRDLRLQVSCPSRGLNAEVTVPRDVLLHYSRLAPGS